MSTAAGSKTVSKVIYRVAGKAASWGGLTGQLLATKKSKYSKIDIQFTGHAGALKLQYSS